MASSLMLMSLLFFIHAIAAKIIFVTEVFRHGARAPLGVQNGFDVLNQPWFQTEELTNPGMRMHYLFGQQVRQKYIVQEKLLNDSFDPLEIYLYVTDRNRTIQSGYSHLSGIYPFRMENLTDTQKVNALPPITVGDIDSIQQFLGNRPLPNNYQTLPLHVLQSINPIDYSSRCFSGVLRIEAENRKIFKNITDVVVNDFKSNFSATLMKTLNKTEDFFSNWTQMASISDAFISDLFDKRDLSYLGVDLARFNDTATYINGLNFMIMDNASLVAKVTQTPFIQLTISYMEKRLNGTAGPKLMLFSAHDTNLVWMINYLKKAFKLDNVSYHDIPFASNIFLELDKSDTGALTVNVIFNDKLILSTSFDEFKKGVATFYSTEEDIKKFCGDSANENNQGSSDSHKTLYIVLLVCLSVFNVVLLVLLYKTCRSKYVDQRESYSQAL